MSTSALRAVAPTDTDSTPPTQLRLVAPDCITPDLGQLPHPSEWTARIARAVIEAVAGERPVSQLAKWKSFHVHWT